MGLLGSDGSRSGPPRNISLRASVPACTMHRRMHGREITIMATLLAMAFTAAPAAADQTLGLGQPADGDGVVTSWTATARAPQTVRRRGAQPLPAGAALVTATSDPAAIGPTATTTAARLPIAAGGELALV